MLCIFYCLSLSSQYGNEYSSIFDGNLNVYSKEITKNQELYLELIFYLNDPQKQILKSINLLAKDIINNNIDGTLFVLGKTNINKLIGIINSSEKFVPIAGIYKEKTQQFYLFHSLQYILEKQSLLTKNIQKKQIITDKELISFLYTTKNIFENFNFNKSKKTQKRDYINQLQSYTKSNLPYSINKSKTIPLIYLEAFHENITTSYKLHYNCFIHGYYMENNITIKQDSNVKYYNFLEIKALQIDMAAFMAKFKTVDIIAIFFLLFRLAITGLYHINRKYINRYFEYEYQLLFNYSFTVLFLFARTYQYYDDFYIQFFLAIILNSFVFEHFIYLYEGQCYKFFKAHTFFTMILLAVLQNNVLLSSDLVLFCIKLFQGPNFENDFDYKIKSAIFATFLMIFHFCEICFVHLYYNDILILQKKSLQPIIITFIYILLQIIIVFRFVLGIKFTLKNIKLLYKRTIEMFDAKKKID